MADTMLTFRDNNLSADFLTDEMIKDICPLAFKTEPTNPNVSDRYTMATTMDVVHDMAKLGWFPVSAKQCRAKKGSSGIRSFHMISFQNPNIKVMSGDVIEGYPRIILQNSHDGFNSFKFMCGFFRLICSNGLVLADAEYANISVRHINYTFDELRSVITNMVESLPEKIDVINQMKSTELSDDEKTEFAVKAIKLRKNIPFDKNIDISKDTIDEVLTPERKEDIGNSVWNVFNVLQENVINGYFYFSKNDQSKPRKMRKITSPIKDININSGLFNAASKYLALAA